MNIFEAAKEGNLERVRYWIIDQKQDPNHKDSDGRTPLHWAAENGQLEVVKWLVLEGKAKVDEKDKDGQTPLHTVITLGEYPGLAAFLGTRLTQPLVSSKLSGSSDPSIQLWFMLHTQMRSSVAKITAVQLQRDLQAIGEYSGKDAALYRHATLELLLQSHCMTVVNMLSREDYSGCLALLVAWYTAFSPADKEFLFRSAIRGGCSPFLKHFPLQMSPPQQYMLEGMTLDKPQAEALSALFAANPSLTSITLHRIQFTGSGYVQLFDSLAVVKTTLEELTLSYCGIGGHQQVTLLQNRISQFSNLRRLDLTGNRLVYNDIKALLETNRTGPATNKTFQELSVCHNLIEGCEISYLQQELPRLIGQSPLQRLLLTGNAFFSQTRDKDLLHLLTLLLVKSKLTIKNFLLTRYVSLEKRGDNEYCLSLQQVNGQTIELKLSYAELQAFNQFKNTHQIPSESEMWKYVTHAIAQRQLEIEGALLNKRLSDEVDLAARRAQVKQLVDYHAQAPLKSYLRTYTFYRSPPTQQLHSLLFPDLVLTHEEWRVYLLANKTKAEHALLAYEGLTNYGQRFFRVVDLRYTDKIKINFISRSLAEQIPFLLENCYIVPFFATRAQVKNMHKAIEKESYDKAPSEYSKFPILDSVLPKKQTDKELTHCLDWAIKKIKNHVGVPLELGTYVFPSSYVKDLIKNTELTGNSVQTLK